MKIKEIQSKSILIKSNLPKSNYVINPYSGCTFGCTYCYASFLRRFTGHTQDRWGDYVDIKINAVELLTNDIVKIIKKYKNIKNLPVIFLSSVTDPYQSIEAKYKLTRKCLEILLKYNSQIKLSILTKSPLVIRDIDLLKKYKNISVGMTITNTEDKLSKLFEKSAPVVSERLKALKALNYSGINTYAFVGPLLPNIYIDKDDLDELFKNITNTGTREVWIEYLNVSRKKLALMLKDLYINRNYASIDKNKIQFTIIELANKYNLKIVNNKIFDHKEDR